LIKSSSGRKLSVLSTPRTSRPLCLPNLTARILSLLNQAAEKLICTDWGFGPRRKITYPLFGDGIFTQEGPAWKHSRELLRPQFTYRQYSDLEILREPIDDLINCISDSKSGVVDLQPLFFRFTLDTTTAFLFGESIRSLKASSKAAKFEEAFNSAQSTQEDDISHECFKRKYVCILSV
jgi:cytochrome P450